MEIELKDVKKITDTKYLNMYCAKYSINGEETDYFIASRRPIENLAVQKAGKITADVVRIVPYYKINNEIFVVLTREFRFPLNDYIYSIPAGNIDKGESPEDAVAREVLEEIGAKTLSTHLLATPAYSSVGMTDECLTCYSAEVELTGTQHLDSGEIIEYFSIPFKDIPRFTTSEMHDFQAKLILQFFYYNTLENTRQKQIDLGK